MCVISLKKKHRNVHTVTVFTVPFHINSAIVTRRRRRGTIEMTLVRPCVRPSVCPFFLPSVLPSVRSCPCNSFYVFHWTDLKFYRFPSYHIKICTWFLIFVSAIFDEVIALADSYLVPTTSATSFIELT